MSRDRIRAQLVNDEGCRLFPYVDTVGKWSIGVGRNLTDLGISRAEAMTLLENDIDHAEQALIAQWPWMRELDPVRYGVLVNLCFNLGARGLHGFQKFLAAVEARDWPKAAVEMADSLWAKQVGYRSMRLQRQLLSGEWQS